MKTAPVSRSWIEERSPEEVAAQIRAVFAPRVSPEDDWDRGWAAAVRRVADFVQSDGAI